MLWTLRDIRNRTKNRFFYFLAVLSVAVFTFPGFVIYLILRPKHTFTEYYLSALEEEALLQSIDGFDTCPNCGHQTKTEWNFCPHCTHPLTIECENCSEHLKSEWLACPVCGMTVTREQESLVQEPETQIAETVVEGGFPTETDQDRNDNGEFILEEEEFDSFQEN